MIGGVRAIGWAASRSTSQRDLDIPGSAGDSQLFAFERGSDLAEPLPYGIRANCLAPETILTETSEQWIPADVQRSLAESHPLRRLGMPEDVARAALFLASDESDWITGVIVDIAGGSVLA
jgi:3-oxoacyl-[acyl-carrier protein] reductase